jgi:hypothetical protein
MCSGFSKIGLWVFSSRFDIWFEYAAVFGLYVINQNSNLKYTRYEQQYTISNFYEILHSNTWNTKIFNFHFLFNHQNSHSDHVAKESITSSYSKHSTTKKLFGSGNLDLNERFPEHCIQFFNFLQTQLKQS